MKGHSEDFAGQLGHYLVRAGLTQQELANKIGMHRNTIVKWMNRTSWPTSRGRVLRIADELYLTKDERKAFLQGAGFSLERWPTEVWTVPVPRDMFFTGRDDLLQSLRKLLVPGNTMALTQAISGLGGIGKTHTAIEYVYRFNQDYEAILWLQADSWEVLVSECINLADELGLPEQQETDKVVAEVQRWLRKHRHWLLILDNVEHPQEILTKFVPSRHQGYVLVTTRIHTIEPLAQTQMLETMTEQEGILFLLRRTKKVVSKAGLDQASAAQHDEARQIWQLMEGLPLALDQAGAYILETGCSFSDYREHYARRRAELLDRRGKRFIGHEASVATTFSLAFERVEALNPAAAEILRACSLLDSNALPEELFREGAEHLGPLLASEGEYWDMAISVLQDYSLVQRNADAKTLVMHRLVQAVLKDEMDEEIFMLWAERIVRAVEAALPPVDHTTWPHYERYLSHARICAILIEQLQMTFVEATRLLGKIDLYLHERGRYAEAELFSLQNLRIHEGILGPDHSDVTRVMNNLAIRYQDQGKYAEAESLYQRVIPMQKRALGPEHPDVASSLTNLAVLYQDQGKYAEAESLYQSASYIWEKALWPQHPNLVTCLNNLATLYSQQGRYAEAEPLYQLTLDIREQMLGPEHPDVASSLTNFATLYARQSKYTEAEPLYKRALHIWEQTEEPEHPDMARLLINLANHYSQQGRYAEAEPLYQHAIHILEKTLGSEHPDVALSLANLATLYQLQGKLVQAELLYRRALTIEEQLGPYHPHIRMIRENYAQLQQSLHQGSETIEMESQDATNESD